jgi:hypothetical protein
MKNLFTYLSPRRWPSRRSQKPSGRPSLEALEERQLLSADTRFVQHLYLDRLDRLPAASEAQAWADLLAAGESRSAVASAIDQSPEARTFLVKGWYRQFLGRQALGGEEQGWVSRLLAGQPEDQTLSSILSSPEFYARTQTLVATGTPDERFVQELYWLCLYRSGAPAEWDGWVAASGTLGRDGVADDILNSDEARMDGIRTLYASLLERPPDAGGLDAFFHSRWDLPRIREAIAASDEFYSNAVPSSGKTTPIVAPNGKVTIYNLHANNSLDEMVVDPANPPNGFAQVTPLAVPEEQAAGATIIAMGAGTSVFDDPKVVLLYNDGHAYEWSDTIGGDPSRATAKWVHLSLNASMIAAGFHGMAVTVDGGIFYLHTDGISTIPNVTQSFLPPAAEQGATLVAIDAGTADRQQSAMVDALFSDGSAWSWNPTAGWQQLGSQATWVAAGLNGASLVIVNGQIQLFSQGPGGPMNTFGQMVPAASLGDTAQGDPLIDYDANGTITEINTTVNQGVSVSDQMLNRYGAGNSGASAVVLTDGELLLFLDTTPPGGNLSVPSMRVLSSGAL